ncbi:hypothetical protein AJ79_07360 [Helicocarpus griseus UAMH5409]|uniref:Uncharacterized protein n=1 Tax=Helicocarpus griseus UAMH5409 TaxID=1447875 RepID=A0A2B7X3L1_9EURO|nr:hypothetical protein AJ79_07360 [Helicocarpus griseus UAMH5409]
MRGILRTIVTPPTSIYKLKLLRLPNGGFNTESPVVAPESGPNKFSIIFTYAMYVQGCSDARTGMPPGILGESDEGLGRHPPTEQRRDTTKLQNPYDILRRPLPQLLTRVPYRTTSSALYPSYYANKLADWNISDGVEMITAESYLRKEPLDVSTRDLLENPFHVKREHYLCGDEQTVRGRYSNNALQPVTAVAFQEGIGIRFGDHKVCQENQDSKNNGYIPDFVGVGCPTQDLKALERLTAENPEHWPNMRILGEAKTAWKHPLQLWYYLTVSAVLVFTVLTSFLGQVAAYMHVFEMRYVFLTTYDYTIFLKQEFNGSEPVLCIIRPISAQQAGLGSPSVLQYLYYLMHCSRGGNDFKFTNTTPLEDWVVGDAKDVPDYQNPVTPSTKRSLTAERALQMTPEYKDETSPIAPLKVYHCASGDWYSTTIQFPKDRLLYKDDGQYVGLSGKHIKVEIIDDTGDGDIGSHGLGDDDDHDDIGFGKHRQAQAVDAPKKALQNREDFSRLRRKPARNQTLFDRMKSAGSKTAHTSTAAQRQCHQDTCHEANDWESATLPSPTERSASSHLRRKTRLGYCPSQLGAQTTPLLRMATRLLRRWRITLQKRKGGYEWLLV